MSDNSDCNCEQASRLEGEVRTLKAKILRYEVWRSALETIALGTPVPMSIAVDALGYDPNRWNNE